MVSTDIITIKDPIIKLDSILIANNTNSTLLTEPSKTIGLLYPQLRINGNLLPSNQIQYFKISCDSFIPTIDLIFKDVSSKFEDDYPKDGDLIEVYIRSGLNTITSKIRVDFDILNITGIHGTPTTFSIKGIMHIPLLFTEAQLGFKSNNSFSHLMDVCDFLGVGFASNETKTNDIMNRINYNNTIIDFVKNIVSTSYKDDNSFFDCYIDLNYYLCFVNVNAQFKNKYELQIGKLDKVREHTQLNAETDEPTNDEALMFSNKPEFSSNINFIQSYSLINNSGDVWISNGYKKFVQYFDNNTNEFKEFFVDPLTTQGINNSIILKGKANDDSYKNQTKNIYLGRGFDSIHKNYYYAKVLNSQNNQEIIKMGISIILQGISSQVIRFMPIYIEIYDKSQSLSSRASKSKVDDNRAENSNQDPDSYNNTQNLVLDQFATGWYIVKDYTIEYNGFNFIQKVFAIRREWPIPYYGGAVKNK